MQKEISFPSFIPQDVQNTFRWLIKVEEFNTIRALAESVYKFLPKDNPEVTDFMAMVLHKAKMYREAVPYARQTVAMLPTPEAKFNLAKCLNSAAFPAEAEKVMAEVVKERPDWIDPVIDHAVYVAAQGRFDEAEAELRTLLNRVGTADRNYAVVQFNLGWHEIRAGHFKEGIRMLGIGRTLRIWGAYSFPYPQPMLTEGVDVRNKDILIVGEGGAGDEIINARFAQTLRDRGARVFFASNHKLESLLARSPGIEKAFSQKQAPPAFDYWAPAMDLPRILELNSEDIPKNSYITPVEGLVKEWSKRIPNNGKLRIGVRWQGNALYEQDLMRSVPFNLMETFVNIPGVEVYSLQRDSGLEERPADSKVVDLAPYLNTWEDTAAAISNLDLVISSCTSVPHLAAAMGKPVWLFCPLSSYYVWAGPDNGRAWYPQVELHRQKEFGNWEHTYKDIYSKLEKLAQTKGGAR
ncbi:hypothetical protein [Bdellovibrio sp. HCB2-146]|uniref:glycosyltransferase family 9 protein n=1 Tax=Bdellovibrio sp. HCB2-146 TaxID=3394362 RepID=UPI0039BD0B63